MTLLTRFFLAALVVSTDVAVAGVVLGAGGRLEPIGTRVRAADHVCSERKNTSTSVGQGRGGR